MICSLDSLHVYVCLNAQQVHMHTIHFKMSQTMWNVNNFIIFLDMLMYPTWHLPQI
jgi:hypothetical protein